MRFLKFYVFVILMLGFGVLNLNAQNQKKIIDTKKSSSKVKTVPAAKKSSTLLKTAVKKTNTARKQQIKKAVRRSKIARRPIKRR